jgi:hypothetical protein
MTEQKRRQDQWLNYAKQRNRIVTQNLENAAEMKKVRDKDRMIQLRQIVWDISRPKSERQPLMTELRNLERKLGYPSKSYNGIDVVSEDVLS